VAIIAVRLVALALARASVPDSVDFAERDCQPDAHFFSSVAHSSFLTHLLSEQIIGVYGLA
jgi:hypothetical protein